MKKKMKLNESGMYLLCGFLVMPFLVEFKIDPRRLKLDCRTMFIGFFGGNGGGDGSFNCSIGLCLPQRPIIIFDLSIYGFARIISNDSIACLRFHLNI